MYCATSGRQRAAALHHKHSCLHVLYLSRKRNNASMFLLTTESQGRFGVHDCQFATLSSITMCACLEDALFARNSDSEHQCASIR
jgi:hypothetical protein